MNGFEKHDRPEIEVIHKQLIEELHIGLVSTLNYIADHGSITIKFPQEEWPYLHSILRNLMKLGMLATISSQGVLSVYLVSKVKH